MTVTMLIFGKERNEVEKVKDAIVPHLNREFLKRNVKAGKVYFSEKYENHCCYIEIEVGRELGSIPIAEQPNQPFRLKEAKEDDREGK